jgi:hypothetical protein
LATLYGKITDLRDTQNRDIHLQWATAAAMVWVMRIILSCMRRLAQNAAVGVLGSAILGVAPAATDRITTTRIPG